MSRTKCNRTILTRALGLIVALFTCSVSAQVPAISVPNCLETFADSTFTGPIEPLSVDTGNTHIAGTLHLPESPGPHPAAVLIAGGGNNAARLRNTPTFFAPRLAACGIAAYGYDKRGTGDSSGDYAVSTFDDFIADAGRAAEILAERDDIDENRVGTIGFSQGGRLAPVVAVRYAAVRFAASVSGPITTVEDTRYYAIEQSFRRAGVADSVLNRVMPLWRKHLGAVAGHDAKALTSFDDEQGARRSQVNPALLPPSSENIPRTGIYNSMGRDYSTELAGLKVPWLSLYGELDMAVPVRESVALLRERMATSGHSDYEVRVVPGVGHSFVNPETGERFLFEAAVIDWLLNTLPKLH